MVWGGAEAQSAGRGGGQSHGAPDVWLRTVVETHVRVQACCVCVVWGVWVGHMVEGWDGGGSVQLHAERCSGWQWQARGTGLRRTAPHRTARPGAIATLVCVRPSDDGLGLPHGVVVCRMLLFGRSTPHTQPASQLPTHPHPPSQPDAHPHPPSQPDAHPPTWRMSTVLKGTCGARAYAQAGQGVSTVRQHRRQRQQAEDGLAAAAAGATAKLCQAG